MTTNSWYEALKVIVVAFRPKSTLWRSGRHQSKTPNDWTYSKLKNAVLSTPWQIFVEPLCGFFSSCCVDIFLSMIWLQFNSNGILKDSV